MRMLSMAKPVDILARMLRNLKAIYSERGESSDQAKALTIVNHVLDLCPQSADDYRDRARLHEELECFRAALADFEAYLRLDPQARDARAVREKIAELRGRVSRLN